MNNSDETVLVAMSGGVDSAVCAAIVANSGIKTCGGTMKLFDNTLLGREIKSTCCSLEDVEDAKDVCHRIGISHYTINCKREFLKTVVDPFVASYLKGFTPNPCIACNRYLKFDTFLRKAETFGFNFIATGHYARIEKDKNRYVLLRGIDKTKDQSYVLHTLTQNQLSKIIFPLGSLTKTQTRQIANNFDLCVAEKKESQDICFVENGNVSEFIDYYLERKDMPNENKKFKFVNVNGEVLGDVPKDTFFTIGQRKGLNLSLGYPVYIIDINTKVGAIVVGNKNQLVKKEITAHDFNWISSPRPNSGITCTAKIRYNMKDVRCKATPTATSEVKIEFPDGISAPAKGQSVILYDDEYVLGGGYIGDIE